MVPDLHSEQVKLQFNRIKTLPPLPRTAARLLEIIGDPEVEIDLVVRIIEQDPPLTARILGLANSAYFGQVREISSVREAVIRVLGLNLVKNLSLSIAMAGTFDTSACREFSIAKYWFKSLGTALLARLIVQRSPTKDGTLADSVFLCGLLHKLGLLLLVNLFPAAMSAVFLNYRLYPAAELSALERDAIGVDHMLAGEWLLSRWHLPEPVIAVIGSFDDGEYNGKYRFQLESVRAASNWLDSGTAGEQVQLASNKVLRQLLGLDEDVCLSIEETFLSQRDELNTVSRLLG